MKKSASYIVSLLVALALLFAWQVYMDVPLVIEPMGDQGNCLENNSLGQCRAYLVDNTSLFHQEKNLAALKAHALRLSKQQLAGGWSHIYYFRRTRWTSENMTSVSSKPMEELAQWDRTIHPLFPEMGSSFLCVITVGLMAQAGEQLRVDKNFRYG
ncbi:hypothetical protein [Fibrella forsythiae]|uniref:Uncharacterized protein n=1 Tax=Fibrella forsythiae TaxID=2817061 RepID=A0ABS3JSI0_9BACT|nr:hypothetical protein [Fibrella forsythiae]MBO0952983.1 hypothetical protein [Fibrella forsythiae]